MPTATLIVNSNAGAHLRGAKDSAAERLQDTGYRIIRHAGSIAEQLAASAEHPGDVVIVDGGDGTIRAAIAALRTRNVPIAILPGGTMNLLARDYGVPTDRDEAFAAIIEGHVRRVDVGTINGEVFLHSAAVGLPARIGAHRENRRGRMAAGTKLALFAHALSTLGRDRALCAQITDRGGNTTALSTPSIVLLVGQVGEQLFPRPEREMTGERGLSLFAIDSRSAQSLVGLLVQGAIGSLQDGPALEGIAAETVEITTARRKTRRLRMMLDGEQTLVSLPATVSVERAAVSVITAPQQAPA